MQAVSIIHSFMGAWPPVSGRLWLVALRIPLRALRAVLRTSSSAIPGLRLTTPSMLTTVIAALQHLRPQALSAKFHLYIIE